MAQMYKVYFNNKLICIGGDNQQFLPKKGLKILSGAYKIRDEWEKFKRDEGCTGLWMQGDTKGIWNKFKSMFVKVKAAGGLVKNEAGDYLLIFRKKKWDLPKGKLEKKESYLEAAVREVEEECGISNLIIIEPMAATYHIYEDDGWYKLKHSHWFAMTTTSKAIPVPEIREGIEKAIWVKPPEMKNYMENMFPSIRDLLEGYLMNIE